MNTFVNRLVWDSRITGNRHPLLSVLDRLSWPDFEEASGNLLKLSIRMVAGFAEVAEKRIFGCGGLQPSELFSLAIPLSNGAHRRLDRRVLPGAE